MNAGVSGAALQSMGKVPVKGIRKKEEAKTAFPELLAGLAAMSQVFGGEQPVQGTQGNQGTQADGSLLNILGQTTAKEASGQLWQKGPSLPMGDERTLLPFLEGKGRRGVTAAVRQIPSGERGEPLAGKDAGSAPGTGARGERGILADTGARPASLAPETAITSGQTAGAAARGGPEGEAFPKAQLETELPVKEASGKGRETAKAGDGLIASSLREAYHLSGREEPVRIKVAEPYYEKKPEFVRALSNTITTELSKGDGSLEIRLEPAELGSLLIKLQTGKDGTHIELHCASEKTALLLDKNLADISSFLRTHTETPVTLQIRQEIWPQPLWNQNQGNSGGRNSRDEKKEKKRDDGIGDSQASDFIEKLRLGLEGL